MPPNTTVDYDYQNPTLVASDIEDWTPDHTGILKQVNVDTWGNQVFAWPDGNASFPQRKETQWYIYWWQSFPGFANTIRRGTDYMSNWWMFTGNWDGSIASGRGLHTAMAPTGVAESPDVGPQFGLRLRPISPNPTPGGAEVVFELGKPGRVRVDVVDVRGRVLRTLIDTMRLPGRQTISWDGTSGGKRLGSGVYWIVATYQGERTTRRFVLIR